MEKEIIYNSDLHFEHQQWKSQLFYWEDELISFEKKLATIASPWNNKTFFKKLEHHQNEIILHKNVIYRLLEAIDIHEVRIEGQYQTKRDALDIVFVKKHEEIRNQIRIEKQIYNDLKKDFFDFLSEYT